MRYKFGVYCFLAVTLFSICSLQAQLSGIKKADSLFFAKNWSQAKTVYGQSLTDTTQNALAWNRLGYSDQQLKLYGEALHCYNKALAFGATPPLKGIILSRTARVLALTGKKDEALVQLDSAVQNGYFLIQEMDTLTDYNTLRYEKKFAELRKKVFNQANPCMADPHNREFDFWVGDWDVYQFGTINMVGHNSIQIIAEGCGLLENWTNMSGQTGKSINFIDPVTNKWKQSWVGGGNQEFVNGEYKDGAMRFTFETTDAKGNKLMGRFIFFNEGPDQVRQFNETSADGGKSWTTVYNFTYIRKKHGGQ